MSASAPEGFLRVQSDRTGSRAARPPHVYSTHLEGCRPRHPRTFFGSKR